MVMDVAAVGVDVVEEGRRMLSQRPIFSEIRHTSRSYSSQCTSHCTAPRAQSFLGMSRHVHSYIRARPQPLPAGNRPLYRLGHNIHALDMRKPPHPRLTPRDPAAVGLCGCR